MNVRDRNLLLWAHRDVTCPDCKWLLFWLVRDYSTRENVTRPGVRRLMAETGRWQRWVVTHLQHLEDDGHIAAKSRGGFLPGKGAERATEYLLPWLSGSHMNTRTRRGDIVPRKSTSGSRSGTPLATPLSRSERDGGGAFERGGADIGVSDEDDAAARHEHVAGDRPPPAAAPDGTAAADEADAEEEGRRSPPVLPERYVTIRDGAAAWRRERAIRPPLPEAGAERMQRAADVFGWNGDNESESE